MYGKYVFAEYCTDKIGYTDTSGTIVWSNAFSNLGPTTFGEDINGELYVAGGNTVYKIVDTSLATNSFDKDTFELYPNPAQNEVSLKTKGLQFPATLTVVDMTGKTIMTQGINAETNTVSIASLQTGLYIVSIKDQAGLSISSKLTVK